MDSFACVCHSFACVCHSLWVWVCVYGKLRRLRPKKSIVINSNLDSKNSVVGIMSDSDNEFGLWIKERCQNPMKLDLFLIIFDHFQVKSDRF